MLRNVISTSLIARAGKRAPGAIRANLFAQYTTKLNTNDYPVSHTEEIAANGKKVFFCR